MRIPLLSKAVLLCGVGALMLTVSVAQAADDGSKSEAKDAVDKILEHNTINDVNKDGSETPVGAPAGGTTGDDPKLKNLLEQALDDAEKKATTGEVKDFEYPTQDEVEDVAPEGHVATGREIYEKILENRNIKSALQYQRTVSWDPGGSSQTSRFWVRWRDYRDATGKPVDGVAAKALVRFSAPPDTKGTAFLLIVNEGGSNDQFVYQPSSRRVRRVRLDGSVGVGGTDFTFGDVAFTNIEAADYERMPDDEIDGVPVYVVTAKMKPFIQSDFRRVRVYAEKEHYVVLRAIYMDDNDVQLRKMTADHESLRQFNEVWLAAESQVENLKEGTRTVTYVEKLSPNVEIADNLFSTFRMQLSR